MQKTLASVVSYVKGVERLGPGLRLFFAVSGVIIWTGIWLTGFGVVSWVLYVPAVSFVFAVVTRICPGKIIADLTVKSFERMLGTRPEQV